MKRIDAEGNIGNEFTDGNPALGIPATVVDAEWLNDVQEEICSVIESAGITLAEATQNQLLSAIQTLANAGGFSGTFVVANNVTVAQNLTGLVFDKTVVHGVIIPFALHRESSTEELDELGEVYLKYRPKSDAWEIIVESKLDDAGLEFLVTSAGQLQYKSSNMSSTAYSGVLKVTGVKTIKV